jgi:hypothetical protein
MLEAVPLIAVTVFFISIFIYAYANLQLEEIRQNWGERRCETLVMLLANMVPTDPNIDPSEFALDNFNFCIGKIIDSSLSIFLQPMLSSFSLQIDATKPISKALGGLKNAATSLLAPLLSSFSGLWVKLKNVSFEAIRIFYNIHTAMDRIFGIAAASLFAGMGLFSTIKNAIGFVIQVVIAILIILCILVIFLFFVMFPFIPIILTMIGVLSATVYSANVSGMSGSFCVAPYTLVKMKNGWKSVSYISAGDELDYGVIEGVLKVKSSGACVSIHNVILSKSHLVMYDKKWISAGEHPFAVPADSPEILYCLNTSTRIWEVKYVDSDISLKLRDWEEIPDNSAELDFAWDNLVSGILNGCHTPSLPLRKVPGRGLVGPDTYVWTDIIGTNTPITQIKIGDYVRDGLGFTKVIGIYHDTSTSVPASGPNYSVWYYMPNKRIWTHPRVSQGSTSASALGAYQLVTESGSFNIGFGKNKMLVRDFTEVGAKRIHETYPFIKSVLL